MTGDDHDIVYINGEYKTKKQIQADYAAIQGDVAGQAAEELEAASIPAYDQFVCQGCERTVGGEERGGPPWFNFCRACRGVDDSGGEGSEQD